MMKVTKKKTTVDQTVPGPAGISDADLATCLEHVKAIADVIAPYAVTLTTAQRKAASRFRKGGDKVIPQLVRVAAKAGISGTAFDLDTMQTQLALANQLLPLLTTVKTLTDTVNDTVLSAHGDAWHSATTLHGVLKRLTTRNLDLRRDMQVISSAFTIRKRTAATPAGPAKDAKAAANVKASEPEPEATPKVASAEAETPASTPATSA